jgi:hypothetical protein
MDTFNAQDNTFDTVHKKLNGMLSVVRCAAHTLQLAVYDTLKDSFIV